MGLLRDLVLAVPLTGVLYRMSFNLSDMEARKSSATIDWLITCKASGGNQTEHVKSDVKAPYLSLGFSDFRAIITNMEVGMSHVVKCFRGGVG